MRRKFLLKVMILSLLFVAMGGGDLFAQSVTTVTSETELASALAAGGNVALGASFKVDNTIEIKLGKTVTLDLNGYEISTEKEIYLIDNNGDLTINDGSENKSGGLVVGLGIRNGYEKPARSIAAKLTIYGGTFKNIYPDNGAAVYNQGQLRIYGGNFYGQNVAISNDNAMAYIHGGYIDGYKYAITNTLLLEITDAQISGVIKTTGSSASTAISDAVTFYEARIGEPANYTSYKTFAEALTAAGNMTGDVTVDILEKVTMKNNLSGNYSSIEFVGKDTDAEIYLDVQGYITATGKKVAFEDLTLSKSAGGFITNAGFMNVAFGVYDVTEVTYTGCNFANGAYASSGKVTYNDCTFKRSHDKYGLWAYGNVDVTVNGGKFDDYRGIKMYAEGAAKTVDLTVKNVDFSAVTDKPAIVLTYGKSVNLENNTYPSTGVFELDKDGAPNGTEVTADIADLSCMNDIYSDCGVLVDGKIYTTIDDAKGVAKEGSVVTLFYEPETQVELPYGVELNTNNYGNVVVRDYYTYAEFNEYVRNGNCANLENKKVVLKDTERSYQNNQTAQFFVGATNINITDPVETVTLNKVTFEFLDDDNTNTYTSGELQVFAKNISFTECTFIGTAVSPWGVSNNENAETAAFIDCEWENLRGRYGVHQNRASYLTVTECTFTDCERGIHTNSSTPLDITITDNTFTGIGDAYGVLCIAENGNVGNATLNITGNDATGQTFLRQLNENATYEQISAILNTDNNTYGTAYVVGSKVPVAKIGDKTYYKFEEAISSVGAGEVVIELLSDATLDYNAREAYGEPETTSLTINGNGKTLTLNQKNSDWSSFGLKNAGAKVVFNDMTIEKTGYGDTSGAWNTHTIIFSSNVEMTDVTVNNSMAVQDGATLNNVTINEANGYYGLWIEGNGQSVTMNGGSITATNGGRGIKIADEYVGDVKQVTLNVTETTFNTAKKAAVLVSSTAGANVTANDCDITGVAEDSVNFVWVDEEWAANFGEVTVNGNPAYIEGGIELYVAAIMKNDKEYGYYKKLQKAVDAVKNGETITLLSDITENVTLTEKVGLYYTIDGSDKTMNGKITVTPLSDTNDNRRITISNINFVEETDANVDFISAVNTNHYPRLTVEGCTFTGSGNNGDVAIRLKSSHSVVINNCTGTKLHSFLQNTSGWNLTINNVTVTESKSGLALGTVQGVTVKGSNITVKGYGIRLDANTYNNNAVIETCTVNAFIPVVVRDVNTESSITFNGTNTMTQTNSDGLWCAIGKTEYETNGVMPEAPATGYVSVTLNDENLDVNGIYNAISGNGSEGEPYYIKTVADLKFFRDQVNGGNNYAGKYVKLAADIDLNNENWTPIGNITYNSQYKPVDASKVFSGVFDGNGKVISNLKVASTVGGVDTQANVGLFGMTGEGAVIKNLTLTNVNINTDGRNVGALIGYTYMATIDNITVNGDIQINGGNNVSGVGGMSRYYAMSATNIKVIGKDGSTIVGNNIVGGIFAEIAPESSTQTFKNLSVENVAINGVGGVGGIVGLLTTGTVNTVSVKKVALTGRTDYQGDAMGRIRLGSVAGLLGNDYATIANATTENVTAKNLDNTQIEDLPIIGANYDASSNATEAKIGDTYYATLQIAINAAKADDNTNTIQLLADITDDVTVTQKEGVNIVIDGKKAENENYQFDGTIYVDGNNRHTGAEKLTIQNVNFYTVKTPHDFISANVANQYTHNVTVKGCNFATSETYGNNEVVGLRLRQAYNIAVENCTSNHIFSLMWSTGVVGLDLNHVTVNNCTEGITIGGDSKSVTITGYNITSPSFGIRASVEGGQFTMTSSTINALVPVVVRNENTITDLAQYTLSFTFDGTNNIAESNPTNYWFVAGETEYKGADDVMPTAPKGQVSVTLNDTGLRYEDVYGNYYELAGEGTADNPYTIANLYELKFFRDQVNAGNNYAGKYVELTADIDLAEGQTRSTESNWEPIGWYIDKNNNAPFNGIFDGADHTISNLVINGGTNSNQGFFGQTNNGEIKNLTFNNAKVSGRLNVGVVAGTPYTSKYTNIKVTGHVEVNGMSYVGGVGGKNAYADWTNITVDVDNTSYVKANSVENGTAYRTYVGGVIGFNGEGGHTFENITSNIKVIGSTCDIGGIFGILHYGNKVENVSCSATVTSESEANELGGIAGVWHNHNNTTVSISNATFTGKVYDKNGEVKGVDIVGGAYDENGTGTITGSEAVVEGKTYETLAKAVEAAQPGDLVELLTNVNASEVILIDKSLTISGNGHKVTSSATRVFRVTTDNTEVTLNDVNMVSTAVRVGTNDVRGISIDITENVKLTLNNCSVDFIDASANDWAYAVNVTGGTGHIVTVNGGTYEGANVINVRGASNTIVVNDATLNCTYPNNDMYYGACIWVLPNQISNVEATDNTFNGENAVAFNIGTGTELTESNNTDNTRYVVAKVGETYYYSLAEAFAAAQDGETVKVLKNNEVTETLKVNYNITLDLNGKTITGTDNATASFALIEIQPGKELTVTDGTVEKNGKITLTATNDRDWNAYSSVISNQRGTLTVNGGTIEHLGGTDMAYGIDNLTNGKGTYAETVINGGTVKSTYRAIRQFLNGTEAQNILTVNGGTIEGANKSIWMQEANASANPGKLTVYKEAAVKGDILLSATAGATEWPVEVSIAAEALQDNSTVLSNNVPTGYDVQLRNNVWGVYSVVAKINETGELYPTLAEAVTAAQDGQTIELIYAEGDAPIAMNASLYGKEVTITGTATVDWSKGFLFVGRGGAGDATLIFDDANLTSASNSASTGIHVSGREKGTNDKYDGTVKIKNSTIELDYLIQKNVMTLDNSTLTVKNGFSVGGRPASETESGEDATATMTLSNNSKVVVINHNGMGLGYEAIGVMDINSGSTFETTQDFLITDKGTMNVDATGVIVNGTKKITNNGKINFSASTIEDVTIDGSGTTYFSGEINFNGANSITSNINGTPFELVVNKGANLLISRFVLGYERAITVYGEIANAHNLTAEQIASMTPSLKFNSTSGVSVGGTDTGRLTAKDAYLEFGSSSWKDSEAEHIWNFENCYVSATSFGNNNAQGSTTSTWDVTFDNSVLAAKNYIKNGVGVTYNFTNGSVATTGSLRIDGTLNVDANSSVTTTGQQNNVQNAVDEHGGINGTINIAGTLTIGSNATTQLEVLGGEVNVNGGTINLGNNTLTLDEASNLSSYGNIYGAITAAAGATIILTGGTYTQDVNAWCHEDYDAIDNGNNTWTVIQVAGTQTTELITGWNWFSTYIKQGNDGLSLLQNALGTYGVEIKSREGFTRYYTGLNDWSPSQTLTSVSTTKMYMIKTRAAHTLELEGSFEDENVEITIAPGWNWIGYPVHEEGISFEDALSNIEPANGDIIKSQSLYAQYIDMFGTAGWAVENGESLIMNPGEGYKYYSNKSQVFRFTYSTEVNSKRETSIETIDNYWLTDANQYSGNMTMLAMLSVDGEIVKGNYEVAAFANGECRGSARPIYIEALDAYVLLMTIHGEEVEELTFKYYDVNYGTEYELNNRINYSDDAIVGSFEEPYMFNLGILNIDESSVENISIYPNPTTTGKEINLQAMCDKVEVFNALGVKVAEYTNVDSIDAIETAGIYVIRVTIDGNARNCRLIVK